MKAQRENGLSDLRRKALLVFALLLSISSLSWHEVSDASRSARTLSQDSLNVSPSQEKRLRTDIPSNLPVSVRVKYLNRKRWAHDLEVEVTNTSDKPIYYLDFQLILPDVNSPADHKIGFPLRYGRIDLIKFTTPIGANDVPIQSRQTHVFKINEINASGWDELKNQKSLAEPKKLVLVFQALNFGDGTGYADAGGTPIDIHKAASPNNACAPKSTSDSAIQFAFPLLAANFLPAKFSFFGMLSSPRTPSTPDINCPGTNCSFTKAGTYGCTRLCDPDNPFHPSADFTGSGDPEGACHILGWTTVGCYDSENGIWLYCQETQLYSCSQYSGAENNDSRCSDGVDNDGDGLIDCDDADCSGTNACYVPSSCPSPDCNEGTNATAVDYCMYPSTGCPQNYDNTGSCCQPHNPSPILVDVDGSGFHLTNAEDGVWFDFFGLGAAINIAWTAPTSTNAWLVLDRNGNGLIDSGKELFGDITPQPATANPNGFVALAEYDKPVNGGNADGVINDKDAIFSSLRLWQDANHNGISEAGELHGLGGLGLKSIDLDYKESKKTDSDGNRFRYRSKVKDTHDAQLGRWAWDVFLTASH